jgi:hypothetical protein
MLTHVVIDQDSRSIDAAPSIASHTGRRSTRGPLHEPAGKVTKTVKTMTCRQLGGPCDHPHRGDDANEVILAQDQHLKDAVDDGRTDHEPALQEMKGRWKRPVSGLKWYVQAKRDFAALPEAVPNR